MKHTQIIELPPTKKLGRVRKFKDKVEIEIIEDVGINKMRRWAQKYIGESEFTTLNINDIEWIVECITTEKYFQIPTEFLLGLFVFICNGVEIDWIETLYAVKHSEELHTDFVSITTKKFLNYLLTIKP
jgi:hypothetical protein